MQKLQEKLEQLCRDQKNAQGAATWALKNGDVKSAVEHQERALQLHAEIAATRCELFKQRTAEVTYLAPLPPLPNRVNGVAFDVPVA
jgi:hypothetical protein